jgi:ammonia channel protein AmtB
MACVCPLLGALAIVAYERCLGNAWLRRLCHALLAVGALLGALMIADPEAMYNMHQAWSIPAISQSYPLIPIGWFFPNYADPGARTVALTTIWVAAIAALTWLALHFTRRAKPA